MAQEVLITPASSRIAFTDSGETTTVLRTSNGRFEFKDSGESSFVDLYANDIVLDGNLTVGGTTTTVNTSSVLIEDPILQLAKGQTSGTPTVDIGFLGLRGSSNNAAFIWDESDTAFAAILTTDDASGTTLTPASYADFKAGAGIFSGSVSATASGNPLNLERSSYEPVTIGFTSDGSLHHMFLKGTGASATYALAQLRFGVSTADTLIITDNGRVGIGTTSPGSLLTLQNDDAEIRIRSNTTTTKGVTLRYNHSGSFGQLLCDEQGVNQLDMKYYALSHKFGRNDSLQYLTIKDDGNVGIGTSAPTGLLHVDGPSDGTGYLHITDSVTGATAGNGMRLGYNSGELRLQNFENSDIAFFFQTTERVTFNSDGNVGIGTTAPLNKLHVVSSRTINDGGNASADSCFVMAQTTGGSSDKAWAIGLNHSNAQALEIAYSPTTGEGISLESSKFTFKTDGKFGIGTTAPATSLDVRGSGMFGDQTTSIGSHYQLQLSRSNDPVMAFRHLNAAGVGQLDYVDFYFKDTGGTERLAARFGAHHSVTHATQPGADFIFSTTPAGGSLTERMRINDDGNVGIGTDNPGMLVDAVGGQIGASVSGGSSHKVYLTGDNSNCTLTSSTGLLVNGTGIRLRSSASTLYVNDNNTQNVSLVAGGGDVGIGTSAPAELLSLSGTSSGNLTETLAIRLHNTRGATGANAGDAEIQLWEAGDRDSTQIRFAAATGLGVLNTLMTLDGTAGNVGIGTTSPDGSLDIEKTVNTAWSSALRANDFLQISNASTTSGVYSGIELIATGTGSAGAAEIVCIDSGSGSGDLAFSTRNSSTWGEKMRIASDGNVGIGTTAPGEFHSAGSRLVIGNGVSNQGITLYAASDAASQINFADGSSGNASYRGIVSYDHSADKMNISTAATIRMSIDSGGKVGIGTTAPANTFEVNGAARITQSTSGGKSYFYMGAVKPLETYQYNVGGMSAIYTNSGWNSLVVSLLGPALNGYSTPLEYIKFSSDGTSQITSINGNVGIGLSSPLTTLDLTKTSDTGERALKIQNSTTSFFVGVEKATSGNRFSGSQSDNAFVGTTSADGLELATNNTVRAIITSDGTLNLKSAKFKINGSAGSSGQTLTTDGSGNISWSSAGSGTISGSGTDNYIPRFNGTTAIENSIIYDDGSSVGIGTATPANLLHVSGADESMLMLQANTGATGDKCHIGFGCSTVALSGTNIGARISFERLGANTGGDLSFQTRPIGGTLADCLILKDDGKVGIGTTAPEAQLEIGRVQTTVPFTSPHLKLRPSSTTNSTGLTTITLGVSTADNYGYSISGWRGAASGQPYLKIMRHYNSAAGVDVMTMDNVGNVGIGTTAPGAKLEVNGETRVSSSASYGTHLNYLDGGTNYISTANSGATYFRGSSNGITAMIVYGSGATTLYGALTGTSATFSSAVTGASLNVLNGSSIFARTHSSTNGAIQILNLKATSSGDMADGFGPSIVFAASDTGTTSNQVAEINAVRAGSDTVFNLEFQTADITRLTLGASAATFSGDVTVSGNLSVSGTTTTIDTTNLLVEDPLILLAKNQTGQTLDSGFIIERGSHNNAGFIWDESADSFVCMQTTDTATTAGNVTIANYAPLQTAALTGTTATFSDSITSGGIVKASTTFQTSNGSMTFYVPNVGEAMRIEQNTGKVGIGTASPSQKLHVVGKALITDDIQLTGSNPRIDFNTNGSSSLRFYDTTNAAERMRIDSAGNVGIGTTAPSVPLHIAVDGTAEMLLERTTGMAGMPSQIRVKSVGSEWSLANNLAGLGKFSIKDVTDNRHVMVFDGDGKVGIGTTAPSNSLHIAADAPRIRLEDTLGTSNYSVISADNGQLYLSADEGQNQGNSAVIISVDNAESLRAVAGGNVGIGTTTPSSRLHVAGTGDVAQIGDNRWMGTNTVTIGTTYVTGVTINLANHAGGYLKVTIAGNWNDHSAVGYMAEFFIQKGSATRYSQPGTVIREVTNQHDSSYITAQILDPTLNSGNADFAIQFKTDAGTATNATVIYEYIGIANSVT